MSDLTDHLWERFGSLDLGDVPDGPREVAEQCVLDWFGVARAGATEPLADILRSTHAGSEGPCTVLGGARADEERAALVNGAIGHALDFDDTSPLMGGHPTVPVLPAALAVVEATGRTGADLLTAYVVGHEVQARIGAAIGVDHYRRGWHQTATVGVFGAAAAVAWLLQLDAERFGHTMGIAASSASGVKANFGTMTKPLHAGQAASRGVMAARLAAAGFTADSTAIDGNQGLTQAASSGDFRSDRVDTLDGDWALPRTLFKFHAACHLTHAGIEATRSLVDQHGIGADDVDGIRLTVNPSILDVCGIPEPVTGLEAKFSLRGTQAFVLHGVDTMAIASFEDGPVRRDDVQATLRRVEIDTDETLVNMASTVALRVGGEELTAHADVQRPATDLAAQRRSLESKYRSLTGGDPAVVAAALVGSGSASPADLLV